MDSPWHRCVTRLLPALSKAKEAAHNAVCKGNLRQIGLGSHLYLCDANSYVPAFYVPPLGQGELRWFDLLKPYLGAEWPEFNRSPSGVPLPKSGTYACPGYTRMSGYYCGGKGTPMELDSAFGACGYNISGITAARPSPALGLGGLFQDDPVISLQPIRESQVTNPADLIAFGDAAVLPGTYSGLPSGDRGSINLSQGIYDIALRRKSSANPTEVARGQLDYHLRHAGRFNVSLADGHVEVLRPEQMFEVGNLAIGRRWNIDNQPHRDLTVNW